jgi:hypothetical protein
MSGMDHSQLIKSLEVQQKMDIF